MELKEKSLICFDCKAPYVFSVEEQQTFQAKGHNHPPKRCPACRVARAAKRPQKPAEERTTTYAPPAARQFFAVKCSECGKDTQVPFEPRAGRPVYCIDCYHKSRAIKP